MKKLPGRVNLDKIGQIIKAHTFVFVALSFVCGGIAVAVITISAVSHRDNLSSNSGGEGSTYSGSLKVSSSPNQDQIQLSDGVGSTSGTESNEPNNASTSTTKPSTQSNSSTTQSSSSSPSQPNQSSGSGSSSSSNNTPPSQPSTLANCVFVGGPRDGQACPASAPTSWSYSTPCYGNGSGLPCPGYSQTGWITASYQSGATYCEFDFRGDGNMTGAQYKRVKVSGNNGANAPDCMTAYPI